MVRPDQYPKWRMLILNDLKTIDRSLVLLIVCFKSCAVIIAMDRQIDRIYLFMIFIYVLQIAGDQYMAHFHTFSSGSSHQIHKLPPSTLQEAKQSGLMLDRLSSAQQQLSHFGVRMPRIIELEKVGKVGGFALESWKRWRFNWKKLDILEGITDRNYITII